MSGIDLVIHLDNRPGALARATEALARAGVNVEGICGYGHADAGAMHFLVSEHEAAVRALEDAGFPVVQEREVVVEEVPNEPGVIARYSRRLSAAKVNVEAVYLAAGNRLVVVTDDADRARNAMLEMRAGAA
jgi:hypothetical protein